MKTIKGKTLSQARSYIFKEAWRIYKDNKKYGFSIMTFAEALRMAYSYNSISSMMKTHIINENVTLNCNVLVEQERKAGRSWE